MHPYAGPIRAHGFEDPVQSRDNVFSLILTSIYTTDHGESKAKRYQLWKLTGNAHI